MLGRSRAVLQKSEIKRAMCCLLAIATVAAAGIDFEMAEKADIGFLWEVLSSFHGWGIAQLLVVICLGYVYYCVDRDFSVQKDIAVFSAFLSLLMIIGLCYRNDKGIALAVGDSAQLMKSCIVVIGYGTLFYCAILFLQKYLKSLAERRERGERPFEGKYYGIKAGCFLFLCWLPYLVVLYPGTTLYDARTMLEQFFGFKELTNHHPYFQILFLGVFVQVGNYLGSAAAGMFAYVLLQVLAFIAVLVYMVEVLLKIGVSKKTVNILLCIYAFLPVFPVYAISIGKNINFSIAVLLLIIFMFEVVEAPDEFVYSRSKMLLLPVILILICLFRNEGLAIVIGCIPCFLLMAKKHWKAFGSIFAVVLVFVAIWFKGILPAAGVASGSIAESLSIPFMQTARTVVGYGDEMPEEEKQVIDKLLVFDTLAERYTPEISDNVKRKYNNDATREDLQEYIRVYLKQFKEHPVTYLDALLNKSYGYFYPDDKGETKEWFVVGADIPNIGMKLEAQFPEAVEKLRYVLNAFREIPLIGYTTSIGFYTWCIFLEIFFIAKSGKRKLLYIFVPEIIVLLVCVASPVNAYFRYGLPLVFAVPFLGVLTMYVWKSCHDKEEQTVPDNN